MRTTLAFLSCLYLCAIHTAAHAELSSQYVIDHRLEPEVYIYISGVISGIEYLNAYLTLAKHAPLFCPPEAPVISPQAIDILSSYIIDGRRAAAALPAASVLRDAFIEAFPCRRH